MYKHILAPTDGTDLSMKAIRNVLDLAKETGARVTVLRVSGKPAHLVLFGIDVTELSEETRGRILEDVRQHFAWVQNEAAARGVTCETLRVESEHPWEGILETATTVGADLIAMASHGRSGINAKLLGSETQKVLTHSSLPVLVLR
ncbi:universal stress protein [Leptospira interrogans]